MIAQRGQKPTQGKGHLSGTLGESPLPHVAQRSRNKSQLPGSILRLTVPPSGGNAQGCIEKDVLTERC